MFKVGQKVWCVLCGEGKVKYIDHTSDYPIKVEFLGKNEESYTTEGLMFMTSSNRALYFSPPIISAETEPPFVPTLVGKKVAIEDYRNGSVIIRRVEKETADKIYTDAFGTHCLKAFVTIYELCETCKTENPWQQAIDHELVSAHLGVAGEATPEKAKKILSKLIQWHIDVATDPRVNGGYKLVKCSYDE